MRRFCTALLTMLAVASASIAPTIAHAQIVPKPEIVWQEVGIDQKLDAQISGDLTFFDESGAEVQLKDYFGRKPIVLNMVYYGCPTLCGQVLNGLLHSSQGIPLRLQQDYEILTISFDPTEGPELARAKKDTFVRLYAREGGEEGWHFLTGSKQSITELADTVGFKYKYDPRTEQYAHGSGIIVLTPEGKVSKYLYGIEYDPRDLRLALLDSSAGKIGSAVDQILLLCFHYDPLTGKYGLAVSRMLKMFGGLTLIILGGFVFTSLRNDRRVAASSPQPDVPPAAHL